MAPPLAETLADGRGGWSGLGSGKGESRTHDSIRFRIAEMRKVFIGKVQKESGETAAANDSFR
jgi:hypothetical protein